MTDTPNDPARASEPSAATGSSEHDAEASAENTQSASTQEPTASHSSTESASVERPASDQPTGEQPNGEQQTLGQRPAEQLTLEQQTLEQPSSQQPAADQQPTTSQQPTQPTAAYPAAYSAYGNGGFGQQAPGGYQPYPGQHAGGPHYGQPAYAQQPYAGQQYPTQPTQPVPGRTTTETDDKQPRRRGVGLVVAALAVGALIGGASGAGVMGIYQSTHAGAGAPAASTGAANITVNNASDATPVTAVAAKASPSVVTISVTGSQSAGTGSGVVLTSDGYVLTNTHVVTLDGEIANPTIQVQDNDGKLYTAKVVGTDPIVDLAVIKLENASGMTPATFADSSKLNVGDRAVAIGAPLGLSGTVTDGIVSALNRSIQIASSAAPKSNQDSQGGNGGNLWNFDLPGQGDNSQKANSTISLPVIQTDAAINPGNSGGALLNSKGEVIGINVAIASASNSNSSGSQSGSIGVGFAIPSDLANRIAGELKSDGKGSHGLLGATVKDASSSSKSTTVGATIASVTRGGAAASAGLQAGDIVTNFNGIPITSPTDLTAQVRYLAGGSSAKLTYVRDDKPYTVSVTLGTLTQ